VTAFAASGVALVPGSPSADPAPVPVSAPIDLSAALGIFVVVLAIAGGFALGTRRRS